FSHSVRRVARTAIAALDAHPITEAPEGHTPSVRLWSRAACRARQRRRSDPNRRARDRAGLAALVLGVAPIPERGHAFHQVGGGGGEGLIGAFEVEGPFEGGFEARVEQPLREAER